MRVAAATSAFMIGVTATSGAVIYYGHGEMIPALAAAAVLGTQMGSALGLRAAARARARGLRRLLAGVLVVVAVPHVVQGDGMSEALERRLGRLLTVGTRLSTAVLAMGLAATFVLPGSPRRPGCCSRSACSSCCSRRSHASSCRSSAIWASATGGSCSTPASCWRCSSQASWPRSPDEDVHHRGALVGRNQRKRRRARARGRPRRVRTPRRRRPARWPPRPRRRPRSSVAAGSQSSSNQGDAARDERHWKPADDARRDVRGHAPPAPDSWRRSC